MMRGLEQNFYQGLSLLFGCQVSAKCKLGLRVASLAVVTFTALFLSACSSKDVYQMTRENRLAECDKLPGKQRDSCREQYQLDYEEYRKARGQALDD